MLSNQVLEQKKPSLIRSSKYRESVLDFVSILRTKSYKYEKCTGVMSDGGSRRCALGVYASEGGDVWNELDGKHGLMWITRWATIRFNDSWTDIDDYYYNWPFQKIADELERGVSLIE